MSVPTKTTHGATSAGVINNTDLTSGDSCISCGVAPARIRPALIAGGSQLTVCDGCWHTAGGSAVMAEREPALFEHPAAGEDRRSWDEVLSSSGLRWRVMRWVSYTDRRDLALQILAREAPAGTRRADSAQLWLDDVQQLIDSSPRCKRPCSRRRARAIAEAYAACADRDGRPLTWISQEEVAAVVGLKSDRQVRRYVEWFRSAGLMFEVSPGTRLRSLNRPAGETEAEALARDAQDNDEAAALVVARQALRDAHAEHKRAKRGAAEAELNALREGATVEQAAQAGQDFRDGLALPDLQDAVDRLRAAASAAKEARLIHVAPVYELRVPLSEAELIEAAETREAMTSANATWTENVRPPSLLSKGEGSDCARGVDKSRRFAPQGHEGGCSAADSAAAGRSGGSEGDRPDPRSSRAVRTAEALMGGLLDRRVIQGVSKTWLAARIAGTGLLDRAWSVQDFADQLHGLPQNPHLPNQVRNPRAWIHARLAEASPALPPSKLAQVREIERSAGEARAQARAAADARDRRAEVDACSLCDDNGLAEGAAGVERCRHDHQVASCSLCDLAGWLAVADPAVEAVRCSHDPATGGW